MHVIFCFLFLFLEEQCTYVDATRQQDIVELVMWAHLLRQLYSPAVLPRIYLPMINKSTSQPTFFCLIIEIVHHVHL
jgi:hypothetical protein